MKFSDIISAHLDDHSGGDTKNAWLDLRMNGAIEKMATRPASETVRHDQVEWSDFPQFPEMHASTEWDPFHRDWAFW
jgi:hypothetical protein